MANRNARTVKKNIQAPTFKELKERERHADLSYEETRKACVNSSRETLTEIEKKRD
jgi:hypothetical protein